ncbi:MAG: transcriptional regulator PpsR [Acetobacteraceae bacterium]|nr:transcriptional regulator PpsR [Acetobacteraceae bacterium]
MKAFSSPKRSLGNLDADTAATLVAAAADLALVVGEDGVIQDLAVQNDELLHDLDGHASWPGRRWVDTVTVESRPKLEALLRDAAQDAAPRWRQVNHSASGGGPDIPVLYAAVRVGDKDRVVAFGRDLRAVSALQQRLVDAQHSLERDYARLRHVEARYRVLFQASSEAILVVDATSLMIAEANPAAESLFEDVARRPVVGRAFFPIFDPSSLPVLRGLLDGVRAAGRGDDGRVLLADRKEVLVSVSMFRQEGGASFLVRLSPLQPDAGALVPKLKAKLLKVVESAPDGFVVTDQDGRIIAANAAFLDLAELATEEQARDQPLERWFGRLGVDFSVLMASLRQHGSVRLFATTLRGEHGGSTKVEISAVSVVNGDQPCLGFAIRNVGRRLSAESPAVRELPRSVEQLTELIGHTSLKDLVREATDVIERLCIQAALELTGDNRASAAEMLGLSRQSLYVKLHRYGLGDLAAEDVN